MAEKQSKIGSESQFSMLLRHKWHEEIEQAVEKVKSGIVPVRRRTKTDKWFRNQWYRALAAGKRC